MRRPLLLLLAILALTALPMVSAAWTSSAGVPASFRPDRSVTFAYTAVSSSQLDLGVNWFVRLVTCQDADADGVCTSGTDTAYRDFGERQLTASANGAGSASWPVSLDDPPGAYRYDFTPRCAAMPCTGQSPAAGDTKHGSFALAYTNTWTRTLTLPAFAQNGTTASVAYRLASTSPDDPDLAGQAELFTAPNGSIERSQGTRIVSVLAGAQQTLSWDAVAFAPMGRQQARVLDATTPAQAFGNTSVLGVHLHVVQPRSTYTSGNVASLYVFLEGHGDAVEPAPLTAPVRVILRNGTFTLSNTTLQTDVNGTAYLGFQGAEDLALVQWAANASLVWHGLSFASTANGTISFATSSSAENLSALRQDVADLAFKGVHLDELGTHNLLLEVGRVALYASLIAGFVVLLVIVSFRV